MSRILIVEDNQLMAETLSTRLSVEMHVVDTVLSAEDARHYMKSFAYDLLVVDWKLPGIPGVEFCNEYRKQGGLAPVLMLTGLSSVDEKEKGLDSGADDHVTKPCHSKEFMARVRALLRRHLSSQATAW